MSVVTHLIKMKHGECGGEFIQDHSVMYKVKHVSGKMVKTPRLICNKCNMELFETVMNFDPDNKKMGFLLLRDVKKNERILFGFPLSKKDRSGEYKIITLEAVIPYNIIKNDWITVPMTEEQIKMLKEGC